MPEGEYPRIGDYEVLARLGAGGMGEVLKVRHTLSQRIEAMKLMLPQISADRQAEERFQREIKVVATLNHENITRLNNAFREGGRVAMVMEYVEGVSLDHLIAEGPIPVADVLNYLDQLLSALAYAHKRSIVHRDIKPANFMLTAEGTMKLMDFGIARMAGEAQVTNAGNTIGTFAYMSPEQIQARDLDGRADLYSLGASAYEMVTGSTPFKGDMITLAQAHFSQKPTPPREVRADIPPALNALILKLMEKDPNDRPQSAEEVRAALKAIGEASSKATIAEVARQATMVMALKPEDLHPGGAPMNYVQKPPAYEATAPAAAARPNGIRDVAPPPPPPKASSPVGWIVAACLLAAGGTGFGIYKAKHPTKEEVVTQPPAQQPTQPVQQPHENPQQPVNDPRLHGETGTGGNGLSADPRFHGGAQLPRDFNTQQKQQTIDPRYAQFAQGKKTPDFNPGPQQQLQPPKDSRGLSPNQTVNPFQGTQQVQVSPEVQQKLDTVERQLDTIEANATGTNANIDAFRREQPNLRGDVIGHQAGLNTSIRKAKQALAEKNPDRAATYAKQAQEDLDALNQFLGR